MKKNPKIFVLVGYGNESETFIRSKELWINYIKNHDINFYFTLLSPDLDSGQILENGNELRVGCKQLSQINWENNKSTYEKNLTWTDSEKIGKIYRNVTVYQYLLNKNADPFWVVNTTVTSAMSICRIKKILEYFECENFFGGAPIFKNIPYENDNFVMLSGAGQFISSDILSLIVGRQNTISRDCLDDVWTSLILCDIPRTPFKRYDFVDEKSYTHNDVLSIDKKIKNALNSGHYHFRVKNLSNNNIKREELDPLILGQIFDSIKNAELLLSPELSKLLEFEENPSLSSLNKLPSIVNLI